MNQSERFAGAVDHAHDPELGDDLAHRPATGMHVTDERDQALFVFIDHNAHTNFGVRQHTDTPSRTLRDEAASHKRELASTGQE